MQQGIRQVREGHTPEAYGTFRQVVSQDPNSEFGWIWLSITSPDRGEKRGALERALQINPSSSHAREALRVLDAEEPRVAAPAPTDTPTDRYQPVAPRPVPSGRGLRGRIGGRTDNAAPPDDLSQMREAAPGRGKNKVRTQQPAPSGALVPSTTAGRSFARVVRVGALALLALLLVAIAAYFVITKLQNNTVPVAENGVTPTASAPTETATTISGVNTSSTVAAVTTEPVATPTPQTALLTTAAASPAVTETATTTVAASSAAQTSSQVGKLLSDAQASIANNDYKTAVQNYKQALQLDPTNVQANLKLGLAYMAAPDAQLDTPDRYGSAVSALKTVTDEAPTWPGGYAQLGAAYAAKGDINNAIQAYRTSLDLDPNGPERWLALAALYDRNHQAAEANYARSRAQGLNVTAPISSTTTATSPTTTTVAPTATPVPPTPKPTTLAPTFTPVRAAAPTPTPTKKK